MTGADGILLLSTLSIALLHTVIGPDHYLPFIVLARAEGWSLRRTMLWTLVCGLGHVLSSIVVGALGVALGWALSGMQRFEGMRGSLAAYLLIGFGLLYFVWGLWRSLRGPGHHTHVHVHADGSLHAHPHPHTAEADAVHDDARHLSTHQRTLWVLFVVFVLGPCEPLIPLLVAAAARHSAGQVTLLAAVFSVATIATMMLLVALGSVGIRLLPLRRLERHVHALAGFTIVVSGLLVQLLGV